MVKCLVDKEFIDSSALSLVLVTQTGLQMRELEIQRQTEFDKTNKFTIERKKIKFDAELKMKEIKLQNKTVKLQRLDSGAHLTLQKTHLVSSSISRKRG